MLSMTGYGAGIATCASFEAHVELRIVNHRQIDVRTRGHFVPPKTHGEIEAACREQLVRGRVDISLQLRPVGGTADVIDTERAKEIWSALLKLSGELKAPAPTLDTLLRVPGLLAEEPNEQQQDEQSRAMLLALERAIESAQKMRAQEGANLASDMRDRLKVLQSHLASVQASAPTMTAHFRAKLAQRVESLLGDGHELDPDRLEREVVLFAAKADITEETVRLTSHLEQLSTLFSQPDAVGKKIDFLLQEVGREVNTIASKTSDASIAQTVVEMKTEVARLREQSLNIL